MSEASATTMLSGATSGAPGSRATGVRFVAVVSLTAMPAWLSLSRDKRRRVIADQVEPVLAAHPDVTVRWVDVEAFTADCSDLLLAETPDLREWNRLIEALRDTDVFAHSYFAVERITVGIEDGFCDYENASRR